MPTFDFDVARRKQIEALEPVDFKLGGITFECRKAVPFQWLTERIELDLGDDRVLAFRNACDFIAEVLVDDAHRDRWRALLADQGVALDDEDVFEITRALVTTYSTGRAARAAAAAAPKRAKRPTRKRS